MKSDILRICLIFFKKLSGSKGTNDANPKSIYSKTTFIVHFHVAWYSDRAPSNVNFPNVNLMSGNSSDDSNPNYQKKKR